MALAGVVMASLQTGKNLTNNFKIVVQEWTEINGFGGGWGGD
jgi:hypothetical protein